MTWDSVAVDHIGHRLILLDVRTVECHDCGKRKLVLPREPLGTTTPPPFQRRDGRDAATPEQIAFRKREALAAVEHARLKRTTATEETP